MPCVDNVNNFYDAAVLILRNTHNKLSTQLVDKLWNSVDNIVVLQGKMKKKTYFVDNYDINKKNRTICQI